MKILIVTASLPYPPASGGAIRVYGIVKGLVDAGHQVSLFCFHDMKTKPEATPLWALCDEVVTVPLPKRTRTDRLRDLILSRQPDIARRLYSPTFEAKLRDLMQNGQYDLVQFEAIEVAVYLQTAALNSRAKLCFDTFNAEYVLQRVIYGIERRELRRLPAALYSWIQARRIQRFEGHSCRLADLVIAVSEEDAEALRPFRPDHQVSVVPSGIFVEDYQKTQSGIATPTPALPGRHTLVFTGKMDYRPNVDAMLWFAEAILPKIQARVRDVALVIVGQQPHERLDVLRKNPAITLTGWVEAVQPYLRAAAVYVAPLRMGSGTRLKLLEAMASECAIVATPAAAAGMTQAAKNGMVIADDEHAFAQAVIDLLLNPSQRATLGKTALEQVCALYDWSVLIPRLIQAYKDIGLE
jgi:glycosyltransferase involved in cell wall biosynthesis